jgi:hypothetical protein
VPAPEREGPANAGAATEPDDAVALIQRVLGYLSDRPRRDEQLPEWGLL